MANAPQRDTVDGTSASASAESYRERRQGNLTRASDGFRSPTLPHEPRRPVQPGYKPDPPLRPYAYNPASPAGTPLGHVPRTWAFFRTPDLGAPRVPFPDRERTRGRTIQPGPAWGDWGDPQRHTLQPATDGQNAPPSHALGQYRPGNPSAARVMWKRPASPILRDHMPH